MGRFLVVDDDVAAARGMARLLEGDGHHVSAFTRPHEALTELVRGVFDVVVTDLEMPLVQGDSILQTARRHQPDACVVVVSTRARENSTRLIAAGACIVADKPLDYPTLMRRLHACRARVAPSPHAQEYLRATGR